MNDVNRRLEQTAVGLTLLNLALGCGLWASVAGALIAGRPLVWLLAVSGLMLQGAAGVYCLLVPVESNARPFMALTLLLLATAAILRAGELAGWWVIPNLLVGGLVMAAALAQLLYLRMLLNYCKASDHPPNTKLADGLWTATVAVVGATAVVSLAVGSSGDGLTGESGGALLRVAIGLTWAGIVLFSVLVVTVKRVVLQTLAALR